MNLEEILAKEGNITAQEAKFLVEQYVKARKNVEINYNPDVLDAMEMMKLSAACHIAKDWFTNNKPKQDGGQQA